MRECYGVPLPGWASAGIGYPGVVAGGVVVRLCCTLPCVCGWSGVVGWARLRRMRWRVWALGLLRRGMLSPFVVGVPAGAQQQELSEFSWRAPAGVAATLTAPTGVAASVCQASSWSWSSPSSSSLS